MPEANTNHRIPDATRSLMDGMNTGSFSPLEPKHIEATRAAFPIYMDHIVTVNSGAHGVMAIGYAGSRLVTTWVCSTGENGYQFLDQPHITKTTSIWKLFTIRVSRAWALLTGREYD